MTDPSPQFSLVRDAWITVRMVDGTTKDVSIKGAFHLADQIRDIGGELPTQSFAILRLLIAMLYRSQFGEQLTEQTWIEWFRHGLPLGDIDDYLAEFEDRFDLFDAERPFFQVADLTSVSGGTKGVEPLIFDLPSNTRMYTSRAGSGAVDLSFAEAARWLVHAQAFDASGIRGGTVGDPRVKGGKVYPEGVAFCGLLGGTYVRGVTLRDTLLFNTIVPEDRLTADPVRDIPPWEESEPDTSAERSGLQPHGPVRLFTWQSRRIRLFVSGVRVVGCLLTYGDKLTPQNQHIHEPMTAWRYSEPQTKRAGQTTYMPREHQPGRSMWRGVSALIPEIATMVPKRDVPASLAPAVVQWIGQLQERGVLPPDTLVQLRAIGVEYGSNNSVVDDILDDQLVMPLAVLRRENRALAAQAAEAVRLVDEGISELRNFAGNVDRAAGGTGDAARVHAGDAAYAVFDAPYRAWLASLGDETDPLAALARWKSDARTILRTLGDDVVAASSSAAWGGRQVSRLGRSDLITTPRAEGWYLNALTNIFGSSAARSTAK